MRWRWCSFAMVLAGAAVGLTGSAARPIAAPVAVAVVTPREPDPWAAAADLFFKVAARDDAIPDAGLPRAVAQDGDGFIWLGTDGGLARWDGTGFKTYSTEPTDGAGALPELMVNTLFTDRGGRLWLGMSAEGLLWRDPETDAFRRPPNRTVLDRAHITVMADDDAGGLWVGSNAGLGHIRGSDHRATLVAGLPSGRINAICRDRLDRLWVAVDSRLFRRDPTGRFVSVAVPGLVGAITALHEDAGGRMWLATSGCA
jgi:ligand-binding sensor domain-containing protein